MRVVDGALGMHCKGWNNKYFAFHRTNGMQRFIHLIPHTHHLTVALRFPMFVFILFSNPKWQIPETCLNFIVCISFEFIAHPQSIVDPNHAQQNFSFENKWYINKIQLLSHTYMHTARGERTATQTQIICTFSIFPFYLTLFYQTQPPQYQSEFSKTECYFSIWLLILSISIKHVAHTSFHLTCFPILIILPKMK